MDANKSLLTILRSHGQIPQLVFDRDPKTSYKEWARQFVIANWTVRSNEIPEFMSQFERLNAEDQVRFQCNTDELNHRTQITNEGEATSFFDENHIWYQKKAFNRFPYISFPAQHGPGYRGAEDITLDFTPRYRGSYVSVGEIKKPGVIWDEWKIPKTASSATKDLARELLGTAVIFGCPRVWCYDGAHLLLLRWKGLPDQWRTSLPDCWLIPARPESQTQVSIRWAFYMFLREGMHAIHGKQGVQGRVLGSARLYYDINSGVPTWHDGRQYLEDHPQGFERELDAEKMLWYWTHESKPGIRFLEEHSFVDI